MPEEQSTAVAKWIPISTSVGIFAAIGFAWRESTFARTELSRMGQSVVSIEQSISNLSENVMALAENLNQHTHEGAHAVAESELQRLREKDAELESVSGKLKSKADEGAPKQNAKDVWYYMRYLPGLLLAAGIAALLWSSLSVRQSVQDLVEAKGMIDYHGVYEGEDGNQYTVTYTQTAGQTSAQAAEAFKEAWDAMRAEFPPEGE